MINKFSSILDWIALLFCMWNARELVVVWTGGSHYESLGSLIFLVWLLPLFYWIYKTKSVQCCQMVLALAVIVSFLGNISTMFVINNFGFALAISAFLPISWAWLLWLVGSFTWMPQASWALSHFILSYASWFFEIRIVLAVLASLIVILKLKQVTSHE